VSDIYYGLMQRHERMDRITVSLLLRAPLGLAAIAAAMGATGSLLSGAATMLAVRLAVTLVYDARAGARDFLALESRPAAGLRVSAARQWAILVVALPLGAVMVLNAVAANLPRYFIEHHWGARELGIFSAAASLISVGGTLVNTVGQSVTPRLARLFAWEGPAAFASFSLRLLGFGALLGLCAIGCAALIGRQVLTLMFRPEYGDRAGLLVALMAAGAIGYVSSLLGYAVTAARSFRAQMPLFAVVAAVTFLAGAVLIPSRGLAGAALTAAISSAVQLAGLAAIFVRLVWKTRLGGMPAGEASAHA
jgi:O-antigen/teichoic acid export membrane protein